MVTMLNPTEQDALVKQIGLALLRLAPGGWTSVNVGYRAIGRYSEVTALTTYESGETAELPLPPDVVGLFGRLRAGMYREGRGTWFNARYSLDKPSAYNLEYDRDEPRWTNPPPPPAYTDELRMFPRDEANVPEWLVRRLATLKPPFRVARVFDAPDRPSVNRPPAGDDRDDIQHYLDSAPVLAPGRGFDVDRLDEEGRPAVPIAFHTDGVWIWPAAVNYYLRTHGVPPEPDLVEHIRRAGFTVPQVDEQTRSAAASFVGAGAPPRRPAPRPTPPPEEFAFGGRGTTPGTPMPGGGEVDTQDRPTFTEAPYQEPDTAYTEPPATNGRPVDDQPDPRHSADEAQAAEPVDQAPHYTEPVYTDPTPAADHYAEPEQVSRHAEQAQYDQPAFTEPDDRPHHAEPQEPFTERAPDGGVPDFGPSAAVVSTGRRARREEEDTEDHPDTGGHHAAAEVVGSADSYYQQDDSPAGLFEPSPGQRSELFEPAPFNPSDAHPEVFEPGEPQPSAHTPTDLPPEVYEPESAPSRAAHRQDPGFERPEAAPAGDHEPQGTEQPYEPGVDNRPVDQGQPYQAESDERAFEPQSTDHGQPYQAPTAEQNHAYEADVEHSGTYQAQGTEQHQAYEPQDANQGQTYQAHGAEQSQTYEPQGVEHDQGYQDPSTEQGQTYEPQSVEHDRGYPAHGTEQSQAYEPQDTGHNQPYQDPSTQQGQTYEPQSVEHDQGYQTHGVEQSQTYEPQDANQGQTYQAHSAELNQPHEPQDTGHNQTYQGSSTEQGQTYEPQSVEHDRGYEARGAEQAYEGGVEQGRGFEEQGRAFLDQGGEAREPGAPQGQGFERHGADQAQVGAPGATAFRPGESESVPARQEPPAAALPSQGPPAESVRRLRRRLAELGVAESRFRIGEPGPTAWTLEQTDDGWRVGWFNGQFVAPALFEDPADASAFLLGKVLLDTPQRPNLAEFDDDEYEAPPRRPQRGDEQRPEPTRVEQRAAAPRKPESRRPQDWPIQPRPGEPPLTLFRGKQLLELAPGTEIDRYGEGTGNLTYAAGTPFERRSLVPDWVGRPYRAYRVARPVEALTGVAIPWFDQPGGGTAYLLAASVDELLDSGHLVEVGDREPPTRP